MRWTEPSLGDKRIRTRFLWFPMRVGGEWRWLERATWREVPRMNVLCVREWHRFAWLDDEVTP